MNSLGFVQLNYPTDITKIFISGTDFSDQIILGNTENIDLLINMINSLELVERKGKKIDYTKNYIDLVTVIPSEESKGNYGSHIVLSERYIYVYPSNYENIYQAYYVKEPELSFQDEDNEIIQFIKKIA